MEIKKTPKADLENKKSIFCLLGLVVALGFLYIVFEWTDSEVEAAKITESSEESAIEEEVMNTFQDNTPPPPPPPAPELPPPPPAPTNEYEEVDNKKKVDDINVPSDDDTFKVQKMVQNLDDDDLGDGDQTIHVRVEKKAGFKGGQEELNKYLSKAIRYPEDASDNGIQGRVIVSFVVNRDGSIVDVEVLRGVHPSLDKEAMRVVKAMPAWTPAEQQGKRVRSKFTLPINFKLATR